MAHGASQLAFRYEAPNLTRIAVVSPYSLDKPGGVQEQVLGIAAGMRHRGYDAWAVGPGHPRDVPEFVRTIGRPVDVPANRSVAPVALGPGVIRRVHEAVDGADVVHVHEPFVPMASWGGLTSGSRVVATFHADPSAVIRLGYRAAAPLLRRVIDRADVVTAVSPVAASAIRPLGVDSVEIPNGVAMPDTTATVIRHPRRVVFLGRDEPRKGLNILLGAWPAVRSRFPEAELVVMGARRSRLPDGVTALGIVGAEQKWEVLASGAVFCAPNLGGESFGITLVEAMAAGCAVVASDLAAFAHVLGGTGRLFPVGDEAGLVEILVGLLEDPAGTAALGERGCRRAERFSWQRVLDAYEAVYRT